jgi:hypothetical protein
MIQKFFCKKTERTLKCKIFFFWRKYFFVLSDMNIERDYIKLILDLNSRRRTATLSLFGLAKSQALSKSYLLKLKGNI